MFISYNFSLSVSTVVCSRRLTVLTNNRVEFNGYELWKNIYERCQSALFLFFLFFFRGVNSFHWLLWFMANLTWIECWLRVFEHKRLFIFGSSEDKKLQKILRAKWFSISAAAAADRLGSTSTFLRVLLFDQNLFSPSAWMLSSFALLFLCQTCFMLCVCSITNQFSHWHEGIL